MVSGYTLLSRFIGPRDVVLSDIWTSWQLPTFTGKVITRPEGHHLDYNVPRPEIRRRASDAETFFAPETSGEIRRALIEKYGVKFVLINKVLTPGRDPSAFADLGPAIFSSNAFVLILASRQSDAATAGSAPGQDASPHLFPARM
jgi:hypothetical protein